jgi:hypothetical protein
MKNSMKLMGLIAGATILTGRAVASDTFSGAAMAPTPATAEAVSSFVDRYAVRATLPGLRNTSAVVTSNSSQDVTLYPTADREVVFVSFHIREAEHIALVETHDGRVTRFTDFAGIRPKNVPVVAADSGDAQEQARSILSPTSSVVTSTLRNSTPNRSWISAQEQAADLLQFSSVKTASADPSQVASRDIPRAVGDSH